MVSLEITITFLDFRRDFAESGRRFSLSGRSSSFSLRLCFRLCLCFFLDLCFETNCARDLRFCDGERDNDRDRELEKSRDLVRDFGAGSITWTSSGEVVSLGVVVPESPTPTGPRRRSFTRLPESPPFSIFTLRWTFWIIRLWRCPATSASTAIEEVLLVAREGPGDHVLFTCGGGESGFQRECEGPPGKAGVSHPENSEEMHWKRSDGNTSPSQARLHMPGVWRYPRT